MASGGLAGDGMVGFVARPGAAVIALDADRFHDHRLVVVDEAELRLVRFLERFARDLERGAAEIHRQGRVGAVIADVQDRPPEDVVRGDALRLELGEDGVAEALAQLVDRFQRLLGERLQQRLLPRREHAGQADAIGREQAGERVDQHRFHAERVGDQASVLSAGAAETVEQIFGDVVAALHGNLLDGVGHVFDGHGDEAFGDLLRRLVADLQRKIGKSAAHGLGIERLILVRAEDRREEIRLQLAEHEIGVGDGERAAAAVAGGPRIGAGRVRPGAETPGIEMQHRAAARRDGMDAHHRRADAHAGDFGVEGALVVAVIVGDVGRGAAHVEADDLLEAGEPGRLDHADDAAGRAGQDRILALEAVGSGKAAGRHHEHQAGDERLADLRPSAARDWRAAGCQAPPPLA